jgi:2-hydroxy-3-keto-5-methylthiopentenyl-1-phosphate phosphatase
MRWAVCVDFDGTVVLPDIGDEVSRRFAGREVWTRLEDDYRAGAIDFQGLLGAMFAPITAPREEIAAFARSIAAFRPGFGDFVRRCRDEDIPVWIVSAGLDVYIEPVLAMLPDDVRAHLELRVNRARPVGGGLHVEFPAAGDVRGCGSCGSCKRVAVAELRAAGRRVAFVGDGVSDACGAEAADLVCARASLRKIMRDRGRDHVSYEGFDEVAAALARAGAWTGC